MHSTRCDSDAQLCAQSASKQHKLAINLRHNSGNTSERATKNTESSMIFAQVSPSPCQTPSASQKLGEFRIYSREMKGHMFCLSMRVPHTHTHTQYHHHLSWYSTQTNKNKARYTGRSQQQQRFHRTTTSKLPKAFHMSKHYRKKEKIHPRNAGLAPSQQSRRRKRKENVISASCLYISTTTTRPLHNQNFIPPLSA